MLRTTILCTVLLFGVLAHSQNQQGLHVSNNSGVTALGYNPAFFQSSQLNWDFTLISGGTFIETDYIFVKNSSILKLLSTSKPLVEQPTHDALVNINFEYYQFRDANRNMHNTTNAFVGSPSFAFRLNRKLSLGFYVKIREAFSANYLDVDLSKPSLERWQIPDTKEIKPTRTTGMVWTEYVGNIAYGKKIGSNILSVGVNAKVLIGNQAVYLHSANHQYLTKVYTNLGVAPAELEYGFTKLDQDFNLNNNGSGFGLDIGFVLKDKSQNKQPSKWRLAASIVDFGFVNFKRNGEAHQIRTARNQLIQKNAFSQVTNMQQFSRALSNELTGNPNATLKGTRFTIFTPTALHLNLDYHLGKRVFVNFNLNRKIIFNPKQIEKENYITTSIRYETRFFEIGLPIVLYNDKDLRTGIWFRLGPITVGSDHVGALFINQKQLSGSDIYFAIRISDLFFKKNTPHKQSKKERCYW